MQRPSERQLHTAEPDSQTKLLTPYLSDFDKISHFQLSWLLLNKLQQSKDQDLHSEQAMCLNVTAEWLQICSTAHVEQREHPRGLAEEPVWMFSVESPVSVQDFKTLVFGCVCVCKEVIRFKRPGTETRNKLVQEERQQRTFSFSLSIKELSEQGVGPSNNKIQRAGCLEEKNIS